MPDIEIGFRAHSCHSLTLFLRVLRASNRRLHRASVRGLKAVRRRGAGGAWDVRCKGSYLPGFSCFDEANFAPLGKNSGIPQRLHNIVPLKVGVIREQFLNAHPLANLPDNHADRYPHAANTGLAPHNRGVLGYPVKVFFIHTTSILRKQAKNKGVGAGATAAGE